MKNFILLSFLVLQSVLVFAQEQPRVSQLFNFDWKFRAGDLKEAQLVTYDDDDWRVLDLPHDFQIEQTWDESAGGARGFKAMGTGWYRKHFKANPAWKGKRVLLDFEGIMLVGDVWVNGRKVGSTDYGYLGFETDITDLLIYDEDNVVAVWASTGKKTDRVGIRAVVCFGMFIWSSRIPLPLQDMAYLSQLLKSRSKGRKSVYK